MGKIILHYTLGFLIMILTFIYEHQEITFLGNEVIALHSQIDTLSFDCTPLEKG